MILTFRSHKVLVCLILTLVGCFSLLMGTPPTQGQSSRLRKLSTGVQARYLEWAWDSRSFAFSLDNPIAEDPNDTDFWVHYDLTNNDFTKSSTYPFLPHLTPLEENFFMITPQSNARSFFYASPNDRYIVYAGGELTLEGGEGKYLSWMIGDRMTRTIFDASSPVFYPFLKLDSFDIKWDLESKSFVLTVCIYVFSCPPSAYIHVYGLESGLTEIVVDETQLSFPVVGLERYETQGLVDYSGDGKWALLVVKSEEGNYYYLMYDTITPANHFIISDPIVDKGSALRFATPDGSQILYIDNQGIYRYDWGNHTSTLLTTEVNDSNAKLGGFSPDGRWFVFVNSSRELYLYDLQGLPDSVTNPGGGEGDPVCPGGGGEWVWIDGVPVFVCGTLIE
ncbi:MAG: hypothetical protein IT322_21070 [Anaerolineae bacterium]|nr:hypothetical protein [Anaerolineae bacterium]